MKIIIEAQHVCHPTMGGAAPYTVNLIKSLWQRRNNDYALTVFDKDGERGNKSTVETRLGITDIPIHECNNLSYITAQDVSDAYASKSYNAYTGASGDIFHFTNIRTVPDNIEGKVVVTIPDMNPFMLPKRFPEKFRNQYNIALDRIKAIKPSIITHSEYTKMYITEYTGISLDNIYVVPQGVQLSEGYKPNNNNEILTQAGIHTRYFLYNAECDTFVGMGHVLNTFEYIASKHSDVQLVILGDINKCNQPGLVQLVKNPFLGRIVILEQLTLEKKSALYTNALSLLVSIVYGDYYQYAMEAFACGCPVIMPPHSSFMMNNDNPHISIRPEDGNHLTYEVEKLITSETLRQEMKNKGLEYVKHLSWDGVAAQTEDVYKGMVK